MLMTKAEDGEQLGMALRAGEGSGNDAARLI